MRNWVHQEFHFKLRKHWSIYIGQKPGGCSFCLNVTHSELSSSSCCLYIHEIKKKKNSNKPTEKNTFRQTKNTYHNILAQGTQNDRAHWFHENKLSFFTSKNFKNWFILELWSAFSPPPQKWKRTHWHSVYAHRLLREAENTQKIEFNMGVERQILYPLFSQTPPLPNSKEPSVVHFGGNKEPKNGLQASRWLRGKDP